MAVFAGGTILAAYRVREPDWGEHLVASPREWMEALRSGLAVGRESTASSTRRDYRLGASLFSPSKSDGVAGRISHRQDTLTDSPSVAEIAKTSGKCVLCPELLPMRPQSVRNVG